MFLIGGPAYSGTTLLALLLSHGEVVCLDEPDFHNPAQSHRGIPVLEELFPGRPLPSRPVGALTFEQATALLRQCQRAIAPHRLGMKTCNRVFLEYAEIYRRSGDPVVAILRDIRDVLARPLPPWMTEAKLNRACRDIWDARGGFDLWVRYEDLVRTPEVTLRRIAEALGQPSQTPREWAPERVHRFMLKSDRHKLLWSGSIASHRVGVWRNSGATFTDETLETARITGYAD